MKRALVLILALIPCLFYAQFAVSDSIFSPSSPAEDTATRYYDLLQKLLDQELDSYQLRGTYSSDTYKLKSAIRYANLQINGSFSLKDGDTRENASLSYRNSKSWLREFRLINYGVDFARGLMIGSSGYSNELMRFNNPGDAAYYYLSGLAVELESRNLKADLFISRQDRRSLNAPTGRLSRTKNNGLYSLREEIGGIGLSYKTRHLKLASLYYHQDYISDGADASLPAMDALSLASDWQKGRHQLALEAALIGDGNAQKLLWRVKDRKYDHSFQLSRGDRYQRPAYAALPHQLSGSTNGLEWSQDLDLVLSRMFTASVAYQSYIPGSHLELDKALSVYKLGIAYRDSMNTVRLLLRSLDRAILTAADSSYFSTKPRHQRITLELSREISANIDAAVYFRYQLEERSVYENNASYWSARVKWHNDLMSVQGALQSWQTTRELLIGETSFSFGEITLEPVNSDRLRFTLSADYKIKKLKLGLGATYSFFDQKLVCIYVNLSGS